MLGLSFTLLLSPHLKKNNFFLFTRLVTRRYGMGWGMLYLEYIVCVQVPQGENTAKKKVPGDECTRLLS